MCLGGHVIEDCKADSRLCMKSSGALTHIMTCVEYVRADAHTSRTVGMCGVLEDCWQCRRMHTRGDGLKLSDSTLILLMFDVPMCMTYEPCVDVCVSTGVE